MARTTVKSPQIEQPSWTAVSVFSNSWVNYDPATQQVVGYMKDSTNTVHLRGLLKGGTVSNAVMFNLPAGYRPDKPVHFPAASNISTGVFRVDPNGDVVCLAGSNVWFDVSVAKFKV